ncbi:hypothetical protein C0991_011268, partial [Blastosporella zonata]
MPPRKKAADGEPTAPTRSSARTKAAAAAAAAALASATPTPPPAPAKPKAPAKTKAPAKLKSKRSLASEDDTPAPKPPSKKAKKGKAKQVEDEDEDDDEDVQQDAADDEVADEPKKMVTILKRGAAPVDPNSGKVDSHMVYSDGTTVWDAMLNQTDDFSNFHLRFYVLQLLHSNQNKDQCVLYTRWGRVGENGQNQTKGPWAPQVAIGEFKKQFKAKAVVNWEDRVGMVARKGKYTWIERDYTDNDDSKAGQKAGDKTEVAVIPDSKLELEVQA